MKLARSAFADVEDSAIVLGVVFNDANREARANVGGIFGGGNGEAAVRAHGFETREWDGLEIRFVQDGGVRLWNRFAGARGGPVIGIFRGAKERASGAAVRIKGGEGSIHDNEGDAAEFGGKLDEHFFRDLIFCSFEEAQASS